MSDQGKLRPRSGYTWWVLAVAAGVVLLVTAVGIFKSRNDSYGLLVQQGSVFTEALAVACQNTVVAESYYDRLAADHYQDLADDLSAGDARRLTAEQLTSFVRDRGLLGAYVYDSSGHILLSDIAQGPVIRPPAEIEAAVHKLVSDFATRSTIVYREDTVSGLKLHYFIEVTNQLDRVIVLAVDASLYDDAKSRTGIGVLAQQMASEPGIEYIVYQSTDGIVVSSRASGGFEAIESDEFLTDALESDSIISRRMDWNGKEILELVRPFSTRKYPFGLLRVGVSLDRFLVVSRQFDQLMIVLALALLGVTAVSGLYLSGRREREELRKDITNIRSVTDQIFAELSTGVMVIDQSGKVQMANASIEKMLGVPVADRRVEELGPNLPKTLSEMLTNDSTIEESEVSIGGAGRERVLLVGRSRIQPSGRESGGVVLVATDITQLREYQIAAARKERLSEMGHLAAAVAHEIRNPLNAISIAAQRLESEFAPADRSAEFAGMTTQIRAETKRLNEIITRFLSLSRAESPASVTTDLGKGIESLVELVGGEAKALGIRVETSCTPGLSVGVSESRLKEILLNLFNNAKEAIVSHDGGARIIRLTGRAQGAVVRLVVADSGPGIPAEKRSSVLAPYFTTKEAGTGIGLSAVHQIVESAGGRLSIGESDLGGAEIQIEFPVAAN